MFVPQASLIAYSSRLDTEATLGDKYLKYGAPSKKPRISTREPAPHSSKAEQRYWEYYLKGATSATSVWVIWKENIQKVEEFCGSLRSWSARQRACCSSPMCLGAAQLVGQIL